MVVERGGRDVALTVTPASISGRSGSYLGIEEKVFQRVGPVSGVAFAGSTFGQILSESASAVSRLPARDP